VTLSADVLSQSMAMMALHAVRTLRCHSISDEVLQVIYKSVILLKLLYVSSAWWGFTNAADRQRIEAFVHHGVRSGFYSADSPTVAELVSDSDDNLFRNVLNNENHVLHGLLPERSTHDYYLRPRSHDRSLCLRNNIKNFLSRMLFKDIY